MSYNTFDYMKANTTIIYYGSIKCQSLKGADKLPCTNNAYYLENKKYLCGVHSDKTKRETLPKDKNKKVKKSKMCATHLESVERSKLLNKQIKKSGDVGCFKMQMMKEVPLREGYLNVFPNNKHQNRTDGFGCSSLSPMRLGPVEHHQFIKYVDGSVKKSTFLAVSLNIENYHQYNKVYPNEVDETGDPTKEFRERQQCGYEDEVPHRHKFDAKTMAKLRKEIKGENRNAPLYSVHTTLDGIEKRFTYVQSRYFYCKAYEYLAKQTEDYKKLVKMIKEGTNIVICGYDGYEVTKDIYVHYCDSKKAFGHELVLYSLLTITEEKDYPWNMYRVNNEKLYDNIAHVGAKPLVGGNSKNENESEKKLEPKTEIVFFHKGKQILNVDEYIESQKSRKKIPTIGKLLNILCEMTLHYEILTELEVCEKPTLDWLSGHYINEFFGNNVKCCEIYREGRKQYVIVAIDFDQIGDNYVFDEEGHDKSATTKNMKKYCDYDKLPKNVRGKHKLLSKGGKLRVPDVFKDHVYPQDPSSEFDHYLDSVKVTFKFDHVEDCELGDGIFDFIEIEKKPEPPKTTVISLKGKKNEWGSQLENCPDDVVYIGRRFTMGGWNLKESPFCNPFKVTEDLPREEAIEKYREHVNKKIEKDTSLKNELASYRGKRLACWCAPKNPCHGDILCEIIENM